MNNTGLPRPWRPPKSECFDTDQDYYCFDFFRARPGVELAAYFDSSIWLNFMLRACMLYPTVLQAATAVGASHRRFELGISPEAFRFCGVALNQQRKALRYPDKDLSSEDPDGTEINMLVSMLMCIFETFQGNPKVAIGHYKSVLTQHLRRKMKRTHSETQHKAANVDYMTLRQYADPFRRRAPQMYGTPTKILSTPGEYFQLDPIPVVFTSLEYARDVIVTEGQHIWHAWHQLELGNLKGFSTQHLHVSRLLEWSKAYAEYSKSRLGQVRPTNRPAYLLQAYREAMYLVILSQLAFHEPDGQNVVPLCFSPETCDYHPACRVYSKRISAPNRHFARMMVTYESLFQDDSFFAYEQHSINLDTGIGASLALSAEQCLSTKVRYQATALISKGDLQTKLWNTMGMYSIAEKLGSIEEHAVGKALVLPDVSEPKWVDVICFLEETKMLLRYCSEDEYRLFWTQEWITY